MRQTTPAVDFSSECSVDGGSDMLANSIGTHDTSIVILENEWTAIPGFPLVAEADTSIGSWQARFLFRVDCTGSLIPDLATSWTKTDRGWVFNLGEDSVASAAAKSLMNNWADLRSSPSLYDSIEFTGGNLHLLGTGTTSDFPPLVLARFPFGTIADSVAGHNRIAQRPASRSYLGDRDARDLLDAGADVLITRDRSVADYARSHPEYFVVRQPADRVYALATTVRGVDASSSSVAAPLVLFENSVDDIVVQASDTYWWNDTMCVTDSLSIRSPSESPLKQIVFLDDDQTSAAFATRLSLIPTLDSQNNPDIKKFADSIQLLSPGASGLRAEGMTTSQFLMDIHSGRAAGYVLALPSRSFETCQYHETLRDIMPWIESDGHNVVPLVASRPYLVVRNGVHVLVDYFGQVIVTDSGRTTP